MGKKILFSSLLVSILASLALGQREATKADSYYHVLRGARLRAERQLEMAENEYLKAIQGSENPSDIYSILAELYFEMWKWDKSEAAAHKAVSFDSDNVQAHEILGKIYLARAFSIKTKEAGEDDLAQRAKEEFLKIIALDPENEEAYYSLGRISVSLSQVEEAEQYYSRYAELNPFSDLGYLILGELQLERGKFEEAKKNLLKVLSINPRNYKGYLILGKSYELNNLWDQAASLYENALEYFHQEIFFLNRLGFSLYILKKYEKALSVLEEVFQVDPSNSQALLTKARILQETNQREKAESIYRGLIDSDKSNSEVFLSFAFFLEDKGDYEGAISVYEALLGKDVKSSMEKVFFCNFRLGILYERLQKFIQAEKYLRKSIEVNPNGAEALNYLGYMLVEREEKIDEAVKLIKRALVLGPENGAYLDSLGWAYYKLKDYEQAEFYLKKAIQRLENDPIINDHLGDVYFQLKEKDKAVIYWKKALGANIEDKDRVKKKIEKALRE